MDNVKTTDWLTRGVSEKQLQNEKKKALKEVKREHRKRKFVEWWKQLMEIEFRRYRA